MNEGLVKSAPELENAERNDRELAGGRLEQEHAELDD